MSEEIRMMEFTFEAEISVPAKTILSGEYRSVLEKPDQKLIYKATGMDLDDWCPCNGFVKEDACAEIEQQFAEGRETGYIEKGRVSLPWQLKVYRICNEKLTAALTQEMMLQENPDFDDIGMIDVDAVPEKMRRAIAHACIMNKEKTNTIEYPVRIIKNLSAENNPETKVIHSVYTCEIRFDESPFTCIDQIRIEGDDLIEKEQGTIHISDALLQAGHLEEERLSIEEISAAAGEKSKAPVKVRADQDPIQIRAYRKQDCEAVRAIWNEVVEEGTEFPQEQILTADEADAFFQSQSYTGVAYGKDDEIVGMYILHPNNIGRCGHIANASYAVKRNHRGMHIGEKLVKDCLKTAHEKGFRILQFNAVVANNTHAIHLYERLGFTGLGTVPGGFHMPDGSYEDIILFYHQV